MSCALASLYSLVSATDQKAAPPFRNASSFYLFFNEARNKDKGYIKKEKRCTVAAASFTKKVSSGDREDGF